MTATKEFDIMLARYLHLAFPASFSHVNQLFSHYITLLKFAVQARWNISMFYSTNFGNLHQIPIRMFEMELSCLIV